MAPKVYEFRVDGDLQEEVSEAFPDMRIEVVPASLVLHGTVIDHSHLYGIIAQFHALGLTVVSASPMSEPTA